MTSKPAEPHLSVSPALPIIAHKSEIAELIQNHQVLIVAGETGSGKSTQLPQICVELGRGCDAMIGHTQPRRLAARSIAARVADEMGTTVGQRVGFSIRFDHEVGPETQVKVMTDGRLLAEIQSDPMLSAYDTLIIDEAHERSLNIDFLLGYLKDLLPRRPDLKLIVTSATIDTERFAQYFGQASADGAPNQPAPVIEVAGRSYPVEIRYRPIAADVDPGASLSGASQSEAIVSAVIELRRTEPGDVLVFCSGEREITEAIDALQQAGLLDTEIVPLFSRLSSADQQRVFGTHSNRRVVVATNVAETSLTVPGIRSVVDVGTARVSRFNRRTKVQRLPIEPVSKASADQRAGRCGRVAPGVCIRLYSEADFEARPDFTEPEIQRTNLASVILTMASLGLGSVADFDFIEPPDNRAVVDGIALLEELGAIRSDEDPGSQQWLTPVGAKLARFPLDPRYGRMILEADVNGCLGEVLTIVSGLSIQDPLERPRLSREAASQAHAIHRSPASDFQSILNLWQYLELKRRELSGNAFRRLCRSEYINFNRVREWQDTRRQLSRTAKQMGLRAEASGSQKVVSYEALHGSILAGLLSHLGKRDDSRSGKPPRPGSSRRVRPEYVGARNLRFSIASGSGQTKTTSTWVMAAELVETNRLWGRVIAPIDVALVERLAEYLMNYRYDAPLWDPGRGTATTIERATLYGMPVIEGRTINQRHVDPAVARELFIHHALMEGDLDPQHDLDRYRFVAHNRDVLAEVEQLQTRARRPDLVATETALFDLYDRLVGADVTSVGHFNRWWKAASAKDPELLQFGVSDLVDKALLVSAAEPFPEKWQVGDVTLDMEYEFDPTSPTDGAIAIVPADLLPQLSEAAISWNVPGFRADLTEALVRSLPKQLRKELAPISQTLLELEGLTGGTQAGGTQAGGTATSIIKTIAASLRATTGIALSERDFRPELVPKQLRVTFKVIDDGGRLLVAGKNLELLKTRLEALFRHSLTTVDSGVAADGLTDFPETSLDSPITQVVTVNGASHQVVAYPTLVDMTKSVSVRLVASAAEQQDAMWPGTRRLLRFACGSPAAKLSRMLKNRESLMVASSNIQSKADWFDDIINSAIDHLLSECGGPVQNKPAFESLSVCVTKQFAATLEHSTRSALRLMTAVTEVEASLALAAEKDRLKLGATDATAHLARLVYPGVLTGVGLARLEELTTFVAGIGARLEALERSPAQDRDRLAQIVPLESRFAALVANEKEASSSLSGELENISWLLEDLRLELFSQSKAPTRASSKAPTRASSKALTKQIRSLLNELET